MFFSFFLQKITSSLFPDSFHSETKWRALLIQHLSLPLISISLFVEVSKW
jgi:hypothetical protein